MRLFHIFTGKGKGEGTTKTDSSRYGLFTLYEPRMDPNNTQANSKITVDIVAVHGLGGDYESTWTHTESRTLWLRDEKFLPYQIPTARVMSFGYNANSANTNSIATIETVADNLLASLESKRLSQDEKKRPIILIAHSLGGVVVKQMLVSAHERRQYQDLLGSVSGAIFFAVPHKGSSVATLGTIATNILCYASVGFLGNSNFVKDLQTKSASLDRIGQAFVERGTFPIHTFFETEKTGNKTIVDKHSASLNIEKELRPIGLNANHITICKFKCTICEVASECTEGNYGLVRSALLKLVTPLSSPPKPVLTDNQQSGMMVLPTEVGNCESETLMTRKARSGHDEQQVTSITAKPYTFLRRVWRELVNPDQKPEFQYWEEVTSNIEEGKWMGGTYTAPSKFDGVAYEIRVAFSTIKWTITVPQYSTWYPGTHSGYLYARTDVRMLDIVPKLHFTTPIFSPLLSADGRMSCDLLWKEADAWGPQHKLKDILDVVAFMLTVDPVYKQDWCREHLPDIPLHFSIRANILVYSYFIHSKEAFQRAALFFARVFGTPKDLVDDSPVPRDDYQLQSSRLVVNELLDFLQLQTSRGGRILLDAPFNGIIPGTSLLSELVKEERRCADILAQKFHILFDPPDKKKLEEMLAKYSSDSTSANSSLGSGCSCQ